MLSKKMGVKIEGKNFETIDMIKEMKKNRYCLAQKKEAMNKQKSRESEKVVDVDSGKRNEI